MLRCSRYCIRSNCCCWCAAYEVWPMHQWMTSEQRTDSNNGAFHRHIPEDSDHQSIYWSIYYSSNKMAAVTYVSVKNQPTQVSHSLFSLCFRSASSSSSSSSQPLWCILYDLNGSLNTTCLGGNCTWYHSEILQSRE